MVSRSSPPAFVVFLDQDYRHKSVAIRIPDNAGLVPMRLVEDLTRVAAFEAEAVSLRHSGDKERKNKQKIGST